MSDEITVKGYVRRIIYAAPSSAFRIFSMETDDGDEEVCKGSAAGLKEGEYIEVTGCYREHDDHGLQIEIKSCRATFPEDTVSILRYLSSGAIKGIGEKLAKRIMAKFGSDTMRIMENEPERLVEIKGISERIARDIAAQISENTGFRNFHVFMQKYEVSDLIAERIYAFYGEGSYKAVQENTYGLLDDISGLGFKKVDEIALKTGFLVDSDQRIQYGILATLKSAGEVGGHTYLPMDILLDEACDLLGIEREIVYIQIRNLSMDFKIKIHIRPDGEQVVYPMGYYRMEENCAHMLLKLNQALQDASDERDSVLKGIMEIEDETGITLDEIQRDGVINSIHHGVSIITGGPGTGKTTTIRTMIRYFENEGMEVLLAAPTGRAAKRMSQAAEGRPASTIHRLLGMNITEDGSGAFFEHNEDEPLDASVVIIDEMSMVDIRLMEYLLKAISPGTRLVMTGDCDQLPSVGAGCVLDDIMNCGCFPVVRLKTIFRQSEQSPIVLNAHRINQGEKLPENLNSPEFFIAERGSEDAVKNTILTLIKGKLPDYVKASKEDIQVLTPMRTGALGVEGLNRFLQANLNPPSPLKREWESGHVIFREGDKVMQIRNNYKLEWSVKDRYNIPIETGSGVFNGDTGVISCVDTDEQTVKVMFDDNREVSYIFKELSQLELAYAITIHKSQGSEYPAVIIPALWVPPLLATRNLLYTAVTRAKKSVFILGSRNVVQRMVDNKEKSRRYSGLKDFIERNSDSYITSVMK